MPNIKKNDKVIVIAGKDKGKSGKIVSVFPTKNRVIVEHVNVIKKTQRATQDNPQGGFIETEATIHVSNVMLIDKKTNKPTRVGFEIQKDGSKRRIGRKSGQEI